MTPQKWISCFVAEYSRLLCITIYWSHINKLSHALSFTAFWNIITRYNWNIVHGHSNKVGSWAEPCQVPAVKNLPHELFYWQVHGINSLIPYASVITNLWWIIITAVEVNILQQKCNYYYCLRGALGGTAGVWTSRTWHKGIVSFSSGYHRVPCIGVQLAGLLHWQLHSQPDERFCCSQYPGQTPPVPCWNWLRLTDRNDEPETMRFGIEMCTQIMNSPNTSSVFALPVSVAWNSNLIQFSVEFGTILSSGIISHQQMCTTQRHSDSYDT